MYLDKSNPQTTPPVQDYNLGLVHLLWEQEHSSVAVTILDASTKEAKNTPCTVPKWAVVSLPVECRRQ